MDKYIPLIARIFLSAIFLKAGFNKIFNFAGTQQYMATAGIPLTGFLLVATIIVLLAGGVSLLLGYKYKF